MWPVPTVTKMEVLMLTWLLATIQLSSAQNNHFSHQMQCPNRCPQDGNQQCGKSQFQVSDRVMPCDKQMGGMQDPSKPEHGWHHGHWPECPQRNVVYPVSLVKVNSANMQGQKLPNEIGNRPPIYLHRPMSQYPHEPNCPHQIAKREWEPVSVWLWKISRYRLPTKTSRFNRLNNGPANLKQPKLNEKEIKSTFSMAKCPEYAAEHEQRSNETENAESNAQHFHKPNYNYQKPMQVEPKTEEKAEPVAEQCNKPALNHQKLVPVELKINKYVNISELTAQQSDKPNFNYQKSQQIEHENEAAPKNEDKSEQMPEQCNKPTLNFQKQMTIELKTSKNTDNSQKAAEQYNKPIFNFQKLIPVELKINKNIDHLQPVAEQCNKPIFNYQKLMPVELNINKNVDDLQPMAEQWNKPIFNYQKLIPLEFTANKNVDNSYQQCDKSSCNDLKVMHIPEQATRKPDKETCVCPKQITVDLNSVKKMEHLPTFNFPKLLPVSALEPKNIQSVAEPDKNLDKINAKQDLSSNESQDIMEDMLADLLEEVKSKFSKNFKQKSV